MTDNRTTELRRLLDERGIEWKDGDAAFEIEWSTPDGRHCSAMYWKPTFSVLISGCTPEQAIAATLGSGTLTAEQVRETVEKHWHDLPADYDMPEATALPEYSYDWQAIADELNSRAERTPGTCHMSIIDEYEYANGDESYLCECSECGSQTWEPAHDLPLYCRNCGKAVKR